MKNIEGKTPDITNLANASLNAEINEVNSKYLVLPI